MKISKKTSPEELNKLFVKACKEQQQGELEQAREKYLSLLHHAPEAPVLLYNLGLIHYQKGEYREAQKNFTDALVASPEDEDALFNLALCQKKNGEIKAAISSYRRLLRQKPDTIDAIYNLGGCLKEIGLHKEAADLYLKVLELNPHHLPANNNAAYVFHCLGESDRAIFYYKKVLELKSDHHGAIHMLNALTGRESSVPPESYVKELFDGYSEAYDHSLAKKLEYSVPENLFKLYTELKWEKNPFSHGLDLGCGTGLCGQQFADRIRVFDGVDLSPKMVTQAAEKNIYDRLETENITAYLQKSSENYDLFLAADVLIYVGELTELFGLIRKRACPGCLFGFSTENAEVEGFVLTSTGRFAYSPGYVRNVADKTGWSVISSRSSVLRKERGEWVDGTVWFMTLKEK